MKSTILKIIFLGGILAAPAGGVDAAAVITGRACVIDGDSIIVGGERREGRCRDGVEIRLHGIDAPEWDQTCRNAEGALWPCGQAASEAMKRLAGGKTVTCRSITRDRYGRTIAKCLNPGGRDIEAALVAEGLAVAYRKYSKDYVGEEAAAKRAGRGIWAGKFMMPWRWRQKKMPEKPKNKS